jgi:SAM-dependent methyltransferase
MNRVHRYICNSAHWRRSLETRLLPWVLDGVSLGGNVLEIGPGPGLVTDYLSSRFGAVTSVEIDFTYAASLARRLMASTVAVVNGDATRLPFADASFSGAIAMTMLHHLPSQLLQDQLLRETLRTLEPGGRFVGSDSRASFVLRCIHWFDTYVPVDPGAFGERLRAAGFADVHVSWDKLAFRFSAQRPFRS